MGLQFLSQVLVPDDFLMLMQSSRKTFWKTHRIFVDHQLKARPPSFGLDIYEAIMYAVPGFRPDVLLLILDSVNEASKRLAQVF